MTIGSAAAATAAAAAMVGFFVTREARQDKVIAGQRHEIQELDARVQGLKARLNELGTGTDDFISVTQVPPRDPEQRTRPPQNSVVDAAATSVAEAPEKQPAGGSGGPDKIVSASGGVAPEAPGSRGGARTLDRPDDAQNSRFNKSAALDLPSIMITPEAPLAPGSGHLRAWFQTMPTGDNEGAIKALEDAARNGDIPAAWKLGRMYAEGDMVKKDDLRAFEYFSSIAERKRVGDVDMSQAGFIANALVALGEYRLNGIANSDVKPDPVQARQKFYYAATFFGDPNAQYHLGRMYLDGLGGAKDTKTAARWLYAAATKGQHKAQAVFGGMLFKGQSVPRDAAKGLMFLKLATDAAAPTEIWIADEYNAAWKQATVDERAVAMVYLEKWREQRR